MEKDNKKLEEYRKALEKIKESPEDRVGIVGKLGIVGTGIAAGGLAAGSVAAAAGATTILGSTTLGSVLGGILVASTPVGWVLGTAAAGGAIAYGFAKFLESGSHHDERKMQNIKELETEIGRLSKENKETSDINKKYSKLSEMYLYLIDNGMVTSEEAKVVLSGIQDGTLNIDETFKMVQESLVEIQKEQSDKNVNT